MGYIKNTSHFLDYEKLDNSILTFDLSVQHTIIKKFDLIFNQVNDILDMDVEFNVLYDEFLTIIYEIANDRGKEDDFNRIKEILPSLCDTIDKYAEKLNYWQFSYNAPKKLSEYKLHIDKDGYLEIMKASVRSKFTCVATTILREKDISMTRYIYSYICREMIESGVQFKLERIIDSIVLAAASKGLDSRSQLWVFFQSSKGLEPQNIALRERNAILYKGLPSISTGLNPINWFVSLARTSTMFQMKDKINEINISFNSSIESAYENSTDMLKVFIYEEATSNRKLHKLFEEFPYAMKMLTEYVYPITQWITSPFISKVFNVPNLNVSQLINILLLNFYAYKFLHDQEDNWQLFDMLTYKCAIKNNLVNVNNFKYPIPSSNSAAYSKYNGVFNPRIMNIIINDTMSNMNFDNIIYTVEQIQDLVKYTIRTLLSYDYYNYDNNKIHIDPIKLTSNYIQYIYNILNNKYEDAIIRARNYLKEGE